MSPQPSPPSIALPSPPLPSPPRIPPSPHRRPPPSKPYASPPPPSSPTRRSTIPSRKSSPQYRGSTLSLLSYFDLSHGTQHRRTRGPSQPWRLPHAPALSHPPPPSLNLRHTCRLPQSFLLCALDSRPDTASLEIFLNAPKPTASPALPSPNLRLHPAIVPNLPTSTCDAPVVPRAYAYRLPSPNLHLRRATFPMRSRPPPPSLNLHLRSDIFPTRLRPPLWSLSLHDILPTHTTAASVSQSPLALCHLPTAPTAFVS